MTRPEVEKAFTHIRKARLKWAAAHREFNNQISEAMRRMLHEAAANRMSVSDVHKLTGLTRLQVRVLMKKHNLDPREGKTLLADRASKVLAENAEALGIRPQDMDLTSPLAYLPMGRETRERFLETRATAETVLAEYELADFDPSGHLHSCVAGNDACLCAGHLYVIAQEHGA